MSDVSPSLALGRCVSEFETALHRLAWDLVDRIFADEYARCRRAGASGAPRGGHRDADTDDDLDDDVAGTDDANGSARKVAIAEGDRGGGEGEGDAASADLIDVATDLVVATSPSTAQIATGRRRWTRETVTAELCEWLISGIVEPAFLRRHGKPGLVAAATRIFGRFDSALNVANLQLAKQYPEGPPSRGTSLRAITGSSAR